MLRCWAGFICVRKNDIKYIAVPSKLIAINFELLHLINRTCNFRAEAYTEPCQTSKMDLFCENKKLIPILTRRWIHFWGNSHLKGVLENRCYEIFSQSTWKITMKNFIFSKVAGWQSATFSRVPWGFYLTKNVWNLCFSPVSFLGKNIRNGDCATLLKMNFFKDIFQGFWMKISPGNFQDSCL